MNSEEEKDKAKDGTSGVSQPEDAVEQSDKSSDDAVKNSTRLISEDQEKNALSSDITYATEKQKIVLALLLIVGTIILVIIWFYIFRSLEGKLQSEITVSWNAPSDLILNPGPPSFWYDKNSMILHHRGPIDRKRKEELLSLASISEDSEIGLQRAKRDYFEAVEQLAYQSNEISETFSFYILLLGGLSGMLGAQLRSISNFVGVASYKNELDISRWWPWYAIRPLEGFLIGVISVLVIEAGILLIDEANPAGISWWNGIALLAGFGSSDFSYRLRLLSKTLFGESPQKS